MLGNCPRARSTLLCTVSFTARETRRCNSPRPFHRIRERRRRRRRRRRFRTRVSLSLSRGTLLPRQASR